MFEAIIIMCLSTQPNCAQETAYRTHSPFYSFDTIEGCNDYGKWFIKQSLSSTLPAGTTSHFICIKD
jgi:hypothetical protein